MQNNGNNNRAAQPSQRPRTNSPARQNTAQRPVRQAGNGSRPASRPAERVNADPRARQARASSQPQRQRAAQRPAGQRAQSANTPKKQTNASSTALFSRKTVIILLIILALAVFIIGRIVRNSVVKGGSQSGAETTAPPITSANGASAADAGEAEAIPVEAAATDGGILHPYADSSTRSFDPAIDSEYGIMVERESGRIVASRDPDASVYPASLTKIMSLIVAVENSTDLDAKFTFTADILDRYYRNGASMAGFEKDEKVPLRDMLYGMMLPSGADAAEGICRLIAGDEEHFVELMNAKVDELGLTRTHFTNSVGLHDPTQKSTCTELAVILDHALRNKTCREVLSTYKYTTSPTEQHPEGIELTSDIQARMEGGESGVARIIGGKTGFTDEARYCLASFASANEDGKEYVIVTCRASGKWKHIFDHINICKKYIGGLPIE